MFELALLGRVDLRDEAGVECRPLLRRPKLLALLVYLAVARPRGFHRRDRLTAVFWPELNQHRARNALRQAVHHLRAALGAEALPSRGDDDLAVARDQVRCDVVAFDELLESDHTAEALDLVRGELLPGFHLSQVPAFERWLDEEREALRRQAAEAAQGLAREQWEDPVGAAHWARRTLEFAPHDEQAMRQLLEALDRAGDRAGAVGEYEKFARRLELDLGVEPAPETQALISAIRNRVDAAADGMPPPATTPSAPPLPPRARPERLSARHGILLGAVAALALVALIWALWPAKPRGEAKAPPGSWPLLVVLPIENVSADPAQADFANGLTVSLIGELAQVAPLRVVAAPSAIQFRNTLLSPASIADSLGIGYLLESSVDRDGERIQIRSRVTRARPEALIWSHTYEGETRDVPALLRQVTRGVARALAIAPKALPGGDRPTPGPVNPQAYDAYLKGLGDVAGFNLERAIPHFQRAIALDSTFAPALAALARAYAREAYFGAGSPEKVARKAEAAARGALALDETLIDAHVALGSVLALDGDWSEAEEELRRAVELGPGSPGARRVYAWYLCLVGRYDAAVAQVREAMRLDPLWWGAQPPVGAWLVCTRPY